MATAEPNLTWEQRKPLDVSGASVALSAGAGCGKTKVLTERFLRDLDGPNHKPLHAMAALTFTDKAARELRQRIRRRCREKIKAGQQVVHWRGVLRALEAAPIGTFHEFCGQWLRRQAVAANIDPDFGILDATLAATVRDEALGNCLRRWLAEGSDDLIELAAEFGIRATREALADLIGRRTGGDPGEWVGRTPDEVLDIWKTAWDAEERPALYKSVTAAARRSFDLLLGQPLDHPRLHAMRSTLLAVLPECADWFDAPDRIAEVRKLALLPPGLRGEHWPSTTIRDAVRDDLAAFRKALDKYEEQQQWSEEVTREAITHGLRFARLALEARAEYDAAKRNRGTLDFDDLLFKTRDVLKATDGSVRAALAGPLDLLLVDEFQDTDPVQGDILRMLGGEQGNTGGLFLVGDPKQSIYRFRGSDPKIFQDFGASFPPRGRLELTENFRSVPGILDFVNALFGVVFADQGSPLQPGPDAPPRDDLAAVEFLWAREPDSGGKADAREARRAEARWLARHLKDRLADGWSVRDPKQKTLRPARADDVAFLFRAMTDVSAYESALQEEGFDYFTVGGSAFYAQQEINDLIALLAALEDPFDAVALAGALRSPFFCLTDDALFWLAGPRGEGDLAAGLRDPVRVERLTEADRWQADRARQLLDRWRGLKDRISIAALVDRVLDESGYEAALLGERFGARKRANARKLVRVARSYDEQGGYTLADFVARLRADLRQPPREEQAATTDEPDETNPVIRLMSIHQAKGLEFPIVVLPDLNRRSPVFSKSVAFDPRLGPIARLSKEEDDNAAAAGESLGWRIARVREQRADDEEALRLFYVATTRARDALVLSAPLRALDKPQAPALKLLASRFDLESGDCLDRSIAHPPLVRVIRTEPESRDAPTPVARVVRADRRMWEVADLIERSVESSEPEERGEPRRPRFLDLDPARALAPSALRLDRLVRALLANPRSWQVRDLAETARQAARALALPATFPLIDAVLARLGPWLDDPVGRQFADAARVERDLTWSLSWPPDGPAPAPAPTVFHGRVDLLARDPAGGCRIVVFADETVSEPRERLRLLLSIRALVALELGPVHQAWRVRLGATEPITKEELGDDDAAVDAVARLVMAINS